MNWTYLLLATAWLGLSGPMGDGKPEVTSVGMAAPDVIAVVITAQAVERGKQVPYEAQPGDEIMRWRQHRYVRRGEVGVFGVSRGFWSQTRDSTPTPVQSMPPAWPHLGSISRNAFRGQSGPMRYPDESIRSEPTTLAASRSSSDDTTTSPAPFNPESRV